MNKLKIILYGIFIIIFSFIFLSFNNEQEPLTIELKVKNKQINSYKDIIEYELENKTNDTYILFFDKEGILKSFSIGYYYNSLKSDYCIYNNDKIIKYGILQIYIRNDRLNKKSDKIYNQMDSEEEKYILNYKNKFKENNQDNFWIKNHKYYEENYIIIHPKQKLSFKNKIKINR